MFDGLKEKLNSFRKDVEETAEEKADAEVEADAEAETAPDDAVAADAEATAAVDTDDTVDTEDEDETTSADASSTDAASTDGTVESEAARDVSADADAATSPDQADAADTERTTTEAATDAVDDADAEVAPESEAEDVPEDVDLSDSATDETLAAEGVESAVEDAAGGREAKSASTFQRAKAFATGRIIIEEEDLEEPLWQLEMALLESDVEMNVAEAILDTIREKMIGESRKQVDTTAELVSEALSEALLEVISVGQFDFDSRIQEADKPVTIIFTGVNGVGKTTSIAKLARYFEDRGISTVMANGDTYRAGANEQIQRHADNLGKKIITHEQGGDPAAVIYDAVEYAEAHDIDVVLGDTAGRLHTSNDLMSQLEKIDRVVDPDMTLFVDEAVAGQDAVQRAKKFNEAAEIDGAILTKADADSQGGAAISIAYVTGKPILFLGVGQGYDDLTRFEPEELVESLLAADE
ncbi:signal recognition particle-docking protein FtsY [Salinigranum rubrum]|uniref:Signal recognition particle receptor FtsY n=1 Tax=Salinigranum rubrum TaxID=755307 RepID=A0A2I8VNV0_9EURY|nr:signal recognition particle-docking protein FtsY [Salinigranum rubrum]AUV83601.1 signal recognition particle-docking protein FtsY [Salinigranum rubrum]